MAVAILGVHRRPAARAAFFGTAAGILFGFQAAVTKVFTQVVPDGLGAILHNWSTYALIVSALVGFYFAQVSLQAGVLAPAVATTNVANPTTSIVLGAGRLRGGAGAELGRGSGAVERPHRLARPFDC